MRQQIETACSLGPNTFICTIFHFYVPHPLHWNETGFQVETSRRRSSSSYFIISKSFSTHGHHPITQTHHHTKSKRDGNRLARSERNVSEFCVLRCLVLMRTWVALRIILRRNPAEDRHLTES